ncbi:MAG: transposase [Phycisphaerales bacterium]
MIKSKDGTVKTPHRARMLDLPACYGQRWQVESFFSALTDHRRGLNCRLPASLLSEAAMRVLAYTVHR